VKEGEGGGQLGGGGQAPAGEGRTPCRARWKKEEAMPPCTFTSFPASRQTGGSTAREHAEARAAQPLPPPAAPGAAPPRPPAPPAQPLPLVGLRQGGPQAAAAHQLHCQQQDWTLQEGARVCTRLKPRAVKGCKRRWRKLPPRLPRVRTWGPLLAAAHARAPPPLPPPSSNTSTIHTNTHNTSPPHKIHTCTPTPTTHSHQRSDAPPPGLTCTATPSSGTTCWWEHCRSMAASRQMPPESVPASSSNAWGGA
jgi:hypothetical protein